MKNIYSNAAFEINKAESLLYAFEHTYLNLEVDPGCRELADKGAYTFYAIWDAIHRAQELLQQMEQEGLVIDAIEAARVSRCENCTLKK